MKALILAAGRGSRMNDLTTDRPKCLVELAGRPLIHWQLRSLHAAGIDEIGIVTGYRGDMLTTYGNRHFSNERWQSTNMVASLRCADAWLSSETCLVCYSDIFYAASAVRTLMRVTAGLAVGYDPGWLDLWRARFVDPLSDAETFRIDERSEIVDIGAKTDTVEDIQGQYMGLLRFTPAAWAEAVAVVDALPAERRDKIDMTGLLSRMIGHGAHVLACPILSPWGEVDSGDDRAYYEREIGAGRLDMPALANT